MCEGGSSSTGEEESSRSEEQVKLWVEVKKHVYMVRYTHRLIGKCSRKEGGGVKRRREKESYHTELRRDSVGTRDKS